MDTLAPVDPRTADGKCCGQLSSNVGCPGEGKPRTVACQLCAGSPTFYRRPENRADGQPYRPVQPLAESSAP